MFLCFLLFFPQPIAVASWDSTVHDTSTLNKVTGSNDRVYAILKVGVLLKNPPGVEIMLRKRIALRVYKRKGFGETIMKAFSRVREREEGLLRLTNVRFTSTS